MQLSPSKHFQTIILELAAIVFLLITLPFWLPIALVVGAGALALAAVGLVGTVLLAMCARADVIVSVDQIHHSSKVLASVSSWPI